MSSSESEYEDLDCNKCLSLVPYSGEPLKRSGDDNVALSATLTVTGSYSESGTESESEAGRPEGQEELENDW